MPGGKLGACEATERAWKAFFRTLVYGVFQLFESGKNFPELLGDALPQECHMPSLGQVMQKGRQHFSSLRSLTEISTARWNSYRSSSGAWSGIVWPLGQVVKTGSFVIWCPSKVGEERDWWGWDLFLVNCGHIICSVIYFFSSFVYERDLH